MGRAILYACLPWAGLLVVSVICLAMLVRLDGSRLHLGRLRRLHRDQQGTVQSLSFVLTVPLFVMIMLFIVQVSQLMIGTVVVHYAAFAGARSAVVWIPAWLDTEPENCISEHDLDPEAPNQVMPSPDGPTEGGLTFIVHPAGAKYEKIRDAAVLACMPICPSRDLGLGLSGEDRSTVEIVKAAFGSMAPGIEGTSGVPRRLENKLAYARRHTAVEVRFYHPNNEPPHWPPPLAFLERYDPDDYFAHNELGWQDEITVTVRHNMALLPGPGRLLARAVRNPDGSPDEVSQQIRSMDNVHTYPLTASATLGNEGEKSVKPYVH
jgi:hypothetical protein